MSDGRTPPSAPLEALLDYLKGDRGFDFSGYKRASLERRFQKRMQALDVSDYDEYLDHLQVHQDEFTQLFDTILINVTGFFRDQPAWEYVAGEAVPSLLETIDDRDPIRVWCAACASGEETYTLAMVLAEALGVDAYMRRVKIYATEVDEDALSQARYGAYSAKALEPVAPELVERYFERGDQRYSFRKDLRRSIIFGRNDLTQDAPISRIDLLSCRNTLMYFNAETQSRILNRLHFALNPWGYLFLGKSEMLITHSDLFRPVNLKRRVFTKVATPRDRLISLTYAPETSDSDVEVRESAFDAAPVAQIVVDGDGVLVMANAGARALFELTRADLGRALQDLELSYQPVDLRSNLELARSEGRTVTVSGVIASPTAGERREFDVEVTPLRAGDRVLGATILFQDVSERRRMEEELDASRRELATTYEELQSTVEELETTNEELQSTNEELETTNEELQSANEELETMNEELQSTNEELETINDELRQRSVELNEINDFLERILSSMSLSVIVVDGDQTVQVWNAGSAELWGVRPDEARGQHLWGLDIGLPMDGVGSALRSVLAGREDRTDLELSAINRRGRPVQLRVACLALGRAADRVTGAILLVESVGPDGASKPRAVIRGQAAEGGSSDAGSADGSSA